MSRSELAAWVRARTPMDWLALGAAVAVFGYVGWDSALWDARLQLVLHLIAIGAIGGLIVFALRGGELPRTPSISRSCACWPRWRSRRRARSTWA